MIWCCTSGRRWYGMIEVWLCWNQKRHVLELLSVWCSFHKLSSVAKISNHWAEGSFMTPFFIFVQVTSFNVLRSMHYLLFDKNNNHYSEESLWLCLWLLISSFCPGIFAISYTYSQKLSQLYVQQFSQQYVQQLYNPKNIHCCSSFVTTKPSDMY